MKLHQKKLTALVGLLICCGVGAFLWHRNKSQFNKESHQPVFSIDNVYGQYNVVPFLVLGSGPASLAAALYGARTKVRTVVLRGKTPGGQLTTTSYIENWPGIRKIRGAEVVKDCEDQAARFGAIMVSDSAKTVDLSEWPYTVTTDEGSELKVLSLFIGTGATPRYLGIPGEQKYWGRGVTTCAICDAPYHKGDTVVVVGGGDSAVEEALELSSYAKEVKMLVRSDKMRASPSMIERLDSCDNVEIIFNTSITEIKGVDGKVDALEVINNKTKQKQTWSDIKGVFLAVGHTPNTWMVKGQVETDEIGYITLKDRTQHTSVPGVFSAGDVSDPRYKQAGVAAGDGIKAGLDAVWWLSKIGYNGNVADSLEPYFFEPEIEKTISVAQIDSIGQYEELLKTSGDKLIILDFYTPFCPSCIHMMPVVEWVGTKLEKKIVFVKVDASIAFDLVKKFEAPKVPHFVVTKQGEVVGRSDEVMDKPELYAFVKKYLK
jgi:thioredoxin reductase (NADPH)